MGDWVSKWVSEWVSEWCARSLSGELGLCFAMSWCCYSCEWCGRWRCVMRRWPRTYVTGGQAAPESAMCDTVIKGGRVGLGCIYCLWWKIERVHSQARRRTDAHVRKYTGMSTSIHMQTWILACICRHEYGHAYADMNTGRRALILRWPTTFVGERVQVWVIRRVYLFDSCPAAKET